MTRAKQLSFFPPMRLDHGGDLLKGKRKGPRPFSHTLAIHAVFRSVRARGAWSLLTAKNKALVKRHLKTVADRHHIKIYRNSNVGNHIHLLMKTQARQYDQAKRDLHRFLKEFAGAIAFGVTGASKANPKGGFWEKRVYTRLLSWGREYEGIKKYIAKNLWQAQGLRITNAHDFSQRSDSAKPPDASASNWFALMLRSLRQAGFGPQPISWESNPRA